MRTRNIVVTVDSNGHRYLGLCKQDRDRFYEMLSSSVVTIIKHHNSKHYIHSIFIDTYDNYPCLL
jgi:hypothetical protein